MTITLIRHVKSVSICYIDLSLTHLQLVFESGEQDASLFWRDCGVVNTFTPAAQVFKALTQMT